ncbi:MAG: hypothetical protein SFX72_02925 [Isosphaeraceae bacterium]|nr:hypothetical protein [Isosphaeraceae bacterium]
MPRLAFRASLLAVCFAYPAAQGSASFDDAKEPKSEAKPVSSQAAAGVWTWVVKRGGREFSQRLELAVDGEKLTGKMISGPESEVEIADGTIRDGEIAFTVTRTVGSRMMTVKYQGKLVGEKIEGKAILERDGDKVERDWKPERPKPEG